MKDDPDREFWREWYTLMEVIVFVLAALAAGALLGLVTWWLTR